MQQEQPLTEIVLTGGPCAGKTIAKAYLQEKLSQMQIRPFFCPEVATLVVTGGVPDLAQIAATNFPKFVGLEKKMFHFQQNLRASFQNLAQIFPDERRIIIYDRAELDAIAYMGRDYFLAMLDEEHLSFTAIRDTYDAVIHLVTAANGAEWAYTQENNKARSESAEQARAMDSLTQAAWIGHPHMRVIDNSTDFSSKLHRTLQAITRVLGVPVPLEIERKYLLSSLPDFSRPELKDAQRIEIEQIYLKSEEEGVSRRIRKRSQYGHATYYLTLKTKLSSGVREEIERRITASEYLTLAKEERKANRQIVRKDRWCFLYRNQYFELDVVHEPRSRSCYLLEIELTEENDKIELPDFLKIDRDVTDEAEYQNSAIAKG